MNTLAKRKITVCDPQGSIMYMNMTSECCIVSAPKLQNKGIQLRRTLE